MTQIMELDDILNFDRLICTGEKARAGWYLDQDAILEAIDQLGIKLPVRIKFMTSVRKKHNRGSKGWTWGTHYVRGNVVKGFHHLITVDQEYDIDHSTLTLWHELAHAMQAERWANSTGKSIARHHREGYKAVDGDWGNSYQGNMWEIEANRIAEENAHLKLCVPAS